MPQNVNDPEKFLKIKEAYDLLKDKEKRYFYDQKNAFENKTVSSQQANIPTSRQYTDNDIHFKDLEHFQRTNR